MKKNSEKDDFITLVIKHFLIMIVVSLLVSLGFYVANLNPAVTLHPNAYRDIIRSIIFVYIFFFSVSVVGKGLLSRVMANRKTNWNAAKIKEYSSRVTLYETIGITFTLVTVINSIMMLTGLDEPKQGVFAYVHLITRLGIITLIVTFISFKEIKDKMKIFKLQKLSLTDILYAPQKNALVSVSKAFTNVSIIYCLTLIVFQNSLPASGGSSFYLSLLIICGVILMIRLMSTAVKGKVGEG